MFQKGELDGLDRGVEWRYPLSFEAWIEFLDLCRASLLHSNQLFFLSLLPPPFFQVGARYRVRR